MEEEWISLNGCNVCIRKQFCEKLGNCAILSVDIKYPEYNKTKRKLIQRIKSVSNENINLFAENINLNQSSEKLKGYIRTWNGPIKLTVFEKMCISNLKKKR